MKSPLPDPNTCMLCGGPWTRGHRGCLRRLAEASREEAAPGLSLDEVNAEVRAGRTSTWLPEGRWLALPEGAEAADEPPPDIVVDRESFDAIVDRVRNPAEPTPLLREAFAKAGESPPDEMNARERELIDKIKARMRAPLARQRDKGP